MSQTPLTWSKKYTWSKKLTWNGLAPTIGPKMPTTYSSDAQVVVTITPAQKAAILAQITAVKALLTFVVGLSNDKRQKLLKLAEGRVGWDEKASSYMANRPDLVPGYVDMAALAQNRGVRSDLGDIIRAWTDVGEGLNDTDMVIGHQILKPEYAFYNSAQEAAKHGVPGAQAIADDLGSAFAGPGTAAAKAAKTKTSTTSTPGSTTLATT
jgi:hypothetical protein